MQRSERPTGLDRVDGAPDARALLADRDIDADDVARLLIDDRVDCDRGLADGPVADDELALAAAEREQRIDDDETGLNRLGHEIAVDDRRRRALDRFQRVGGDGPLPVERATERIDDAAEQCRPHRHAHHIARAAHRIAGLDRVHVVQQDAADPVAFEHLGEAELSLVEAQQLVEPDVGQPGDERDAVADLLDPADLFGLRAERGGAKLCAGVARARRPLGCQGRLSCVRSARILVRSARQLLLTTRWGPCSSRPAMSAGSALKAICGWAPNASPISSR